MFFILIVYKTKCNQSADTYRLNSKDKLSNTIVYGDGNRFSRLKKLSLKISRRGSR